LLLCPTVRLLARREKRDHSEIVRRTMVTRRQSGLEANVSHLTMIFALSTSILSFSVEGIGPSLSLSF
jgi:hypothetical protein